MIYLMLWRIRVNIENQICFDRKQPLQNDHHRNIYNLIIKY